MALVEAGDIEGLRVFRINPISSSPKAMALSRLGDHRHQGAAQRRMTKIDSSKL